MPASFAVLGEINTLAGNRNSIRTREALMTNSKAFGDAPLEAFFPVDEDIGSTRDLAEVIMMVIPEAWQNGHLGLQVSGLHERRIAVEQAAGYTCFLKELHLRVQLLVDSQGIVKLTCERLRNLMQPEKKDRWGKEMFSQESHPKALQTCDEAMRFRHRDIE
eukprot:Skav230376  [mRNA]  locus=scaffold62:15313:17233:+ [translate_table: standard]